MGGDGFAPVLEVLGVHDLNLVPSPMNMTRTPFFLLLAVVASSTVSIAGCASRPAAPPARIAIVDRPNAIDHWFRYVLWNGEHYSPQAFADSARRAGVRSLELYDATDLTHERCAAVLAATLRVPLQRPASNEFGRTAVVRDPSLRVCDIGDKAGPVDPGYFVRRLTHLNDGIVLDDRAPTSARAVVTQLDELGARELVVSRASADDLSCFEAIARESGLRLFETDDAGTLHETNVRSELPLDDACRPARRQ